ncbi:short-chain dehydrogenase/reductase family protein [Favolaschia claudopus]|uniref:Short-chain dehydrogenase/reductase family protein n=1 Tax=Favolaschia claudopus TaxID=2862362 RepID=A0AAW0BKC4_9AGAR
MSSLPEFSFSTTADEVAAALAAEIKGKNGIYLAPPSNLIQFRRWSNPISTVLITGTSIGGIGFETARVLAKYASLVIITGHNAERLKLSEDAIKKETPTANIRTLLLDLSSLESIRTAAAQLEDLDALHVLIHNAAAPIGPFKLTRDNLESQSATDHIGPFLFTRLLSPKLLSSNKTTFTPRVVWVSSSAHASVPAFDVNQVVGMGKDAVTEGTYEPMKVYSNVKAANVLMAVEVSRRSGGRVNGYSLCPGMVYTNMHQKEESLATLQTLGILGADGKPSTDKFAFKTIPQGASTTIVAAFDPRLDDQPGAYLSNAAIANETRAAHSADAANAERLWTQTEEILGEKFAF